MSSLTIAPYRARRTWPMGVREVAGWKLKLYGISTDNEPIPEATVEEAIKVAANEVSWPDSDALRAGFLTIHWGDQAVWLLIDLWVADILRHFLFFAPTSDPCDFSPGPDDGTTACVWELQVIKHERDVWVRHVLTNPSDPDVDGYLSDMLEIK